MLPELSEGKVINQLLLFQSGNGFIHLFASKVMPKKSLSYFAFAARTIAKIAVSGIKTTLRGTRIRQLALPRLSVSHPQVSLSPA